MAKHDTNFEAYLSGQQGSAVVNPAEAASSGSKAETAAVVGTKDKTTEQPSSAFLRGKKKLNREDQELYDMTDHELLVMMVKETRADKKAQKKATLGAWIIALILFVACVILVPKAIITMNQLNTTLESITETSTQLQGTLSGINTMVSDADKVVTDNTEYVNEAVQKLNSIDFDALNESIQSLQKIVTPLANLFH